MSHMDEIDNSLLQHVMHAADELRGLLEEMGPSYEIVEAKKKLHECVMWAISINAQ